jgi:hypothetical protein
LLGDEGFELEESLGAEVVPAAALAFEASVDLGFDIFFYGS